MEEEKPDFHMPKPLTEAMDVDLEDDDQKL